MDKDRKITTAEIEVRVAGYFGYRQNIIVPNISWGVNLHECDLLIVRKSGYGIEVEIKVSKSDLIADAKKPHQHQDRLNRLSELYFAIPDYIQDCIEYIPERAGVLVLTRTEYGLIIRRIRDPQKNKNRNKFTAEEMGKIAHLGAMRIWELKRKINTYYRRQRRKSKPDKQQLNLNL